MNKHNNRRDFLKYAMTAVAGAGFATGCRFVLFAQTGEGSILSRIKKNAVRENGEWNGAKDVPDTVSATTNIRLAGDTEDRLLIRGTVFQPDGKTPAPNVLIYFYHTDSKGIYGREGEHRHGRYRGWLLTDAAGRFEFETIKPAPYPGRRFAAHIHMTVTTVDLKEDWIDSILFEDDRLISDSERRLAGKKGGFNPILKLVKNPNGVWQGTRDIELWRN